MRNRFFCIRLTENGVSKINQKFPVINFFDAAVDHGRLIGLDDLKAIEKNLGLDAEENILNVGDLAKMLFNIYPDYEWKESITPDNLSASPALSDTRAEGIYNKAVFMTGGDNAFYTQNLEKELNELLKKSPDDYQGTVLDQWVKGRISQKDGKEETNVLEVLPLNSEQRFSIEKSLENALTVIQGPPGTGKSQVVTNLLINAIYQGKKILFVSRNNKAVDVVEKRVRDLSDNSILIRTGSGHYRTKLIEYLIKILKIRPSDDDRKAFKNSKVYHEKLKNQLAQLMQNEKEIINLRNATDDLDQDVVEIEDKVGSEIFGQLKKIDPEEFRCAVNAFNKALDNARKDKQKGLAWLFWFITKRSRYAELIWNADKNIKPLALECGIDVPAAVKDGIQPWVDFSVQINERLSFVEKIKAFVDSLVSLQAAKPLEKISAEKLALTEKMTENTQKMWRQWQKIKFSRKWWKDQLANLPANEKQSIANYLAQFKLVGDMSDEDLKKFQAFTDKIAHLLPALAVTSLATRGRVPFTAGHFDIVVFDEASQCDIASALPILYRAKQAVIIGDPEQLQHISRINKKEDIGLLKKYDLLDNYAQWSYSGQSLFDLAVSLDAEYDKDILLKEHFRSHRDIIGFSNEHFYDGGLEIITKYKNLCILSSEKDGVRWVNVIGAVERPRTGGARNATEAKAVMSEIKKLIESGYKGSIGVVAPFREQANLINWLVRKDNALAIELLKPERNFIADTVHKFQGDERDLMIFSPVLSKNMPTSSVRFMRNNDNLFNVAITRARAMLLVIGDREAALKCDVPYLKKFAQHIQKIEERSSDEPVLPNSECEYPPVSNSDEVSDWERRFYTALCRAGIKAIPQYPTAGYKLDFALFDETNKGRQLNIEIDGERYHKEWTGKQCKLDQIRDQRLFDLGWEVKRFWVYEIRDDINRCVKQVRELLKYNTKSPA